jgi:hypothetical protein
MKKLQDLGIDIGLFQTEGKDKPQFMHPGVLDKNLEEFLKIKEKVAAINSTGLKKPLVTDSMAEFKHLISNFEQLDTELIVTQSLQARAAALASSKQSRLRRELAKQEKEEHFKHRDIKLLEKLACPEPEPGYYEDKPVKPGFDFFSCLMRCPRRDVTKLALNLPNSMYFKDKIFHIYTGPDGLIRYSDNISYQEFYNQISANQRKASQPFDKVAAVLRMRGENYSDIRKQVLDYTVFASKMSSHDLNPMSMVQQYVRCAGGRPGVVRLNYFSYGAKANFGYFVNSLGLEHPSSSQNEELSKCVVNTAKPEHLEVFRQAGAVLKPYEAEAAKIVGFLNKGYNLRINEIVLDFIKDEHGVIWLSGCKRIVFDAVSIRVALKPKKMPWEDLSEEEESKSSPVSSKDRLTGCGKV